MKLGSTKLKASLRSRVALGVALPIFIILVLLSLFNYGRKIQLLNEQTRLHAAQLGELMIQSLNHAMVSKDGTHLSISLADISRLEGVEQVRLIGLSGKVLADSRGEMEERQFSLEDTECQACHRYPVGEMPQAIAFPQEREGLRVSTPINNSPQCFECHGDSTLHLGVLLLDISFSEQQGNLLKDLRMDIIISVLSTILISLGSYFVVHQLVVRRVENLKQPIEEFSNGNFSVRIKDVSRIEDELSGFVDTVNDMAAQLGEHAKLEVERQQLRERAIVEERERIARELHDGLAQVLGYVNTKAMAVRLMLENGRVQEAEVHLRQLEEAARGVFVDVREAILGLRMTANAETGLLIALDEYVTQFTELSGIPVHIEKIGDQTDLGLSNETELHLFRIIQEALTNIRKHALATQAKVVIAHDNGLVRLSIEDDGVGFDSNSIKLEDQERFGLNTMLERSKEIGAVLKINTKLGAGTQILVELTTDEK
jgi:signal transduction histidine kinase